MKNDQKLEFENINEETKKDGEKKRRWMLPMLLILLILLLVLTSWVLVMRLGNFATVETDSIFLVQAAPGFAVEDKEQVWGTETRIDLFDTEYHGIGRDVTVQSENGDRLIAPGTENEYTFKLKNTGNVAMDYIVNIDVQLFMEGKEISLDEFPLGVRLRHYSGEYLLGDGKHWVSVAELEDYIEEATLAVNNYAWYSIEWKWLFEEDVIDDHGHLQTNVGDELDTLLGNVTAETPINLSVSISTLAQPCEDLTAPGGVDQGDDADEASGLLFKDGQFGGRIRVWPFILLLLAVAIVGTALGYYWAKQRKVRGEQ